MRRYATAFLPAIRTRASRGRALARAHEGHGVPAVPELVGLRGDCWSGEHRIEGFVTSLGQRPDGCTFVLFDHDRDGVLDEWGAIESAEIHERGLTDAGRWTRFF